MLTDEAFAPSRAPISERKMLANRANARKSTGPRTAKGKETSSGNAWRHGMCALTIVIPGEDQGPYLARAARWQAELNPGKSDAAAYLVDRAVLHASRLDRCAAVHDARLAELARDAEEAAEEERMVRVDELMRMIANDPDVAVRRLRQIPEGCDALIREWDLLRVALIGPWHWDLADEGRSFRLLGLYSNVAEKTPTPLRLPTLAILEHREVAEKLRKNEHPGWITWKERYDHPDKHQYDRDRIDDLRGKAARARDYILAYLEAEVADLGRRRGELRSRRAASRDEATIRARFDTSDAGKLIRRYEADAERGLLKLFAEAGKLSPLGSEVAAGRKLADAGPEQPEPAPAVRNEPTEAGPRRGAEGRDGASGAVQSSPGRASRRRRDVRK